MTEDKSKDVIVEGTQFYRRRNFRDAFRYIVITVVVFGMFSFITLWFAIDSGARKAYREARDVRKAFRAVGIEYYGDMQSIYDPNRSNGMAEGAAEKLAEISQCNGTVTLYEWDETGNGPLSFEYCKGLYRVVYTDTGMESGMQSGIEGNFKVYYSFELFKYEAE